MALAREQIVVAAKVSPDARTWKPDEDHDLRLVRHELAWLNHVAILQTGEVPGHAGATVTKVWEPKAKPEPAGELTDTRSVIRRESIGQVLADR